MRYSKKIIHLISRFFFPLRKNIFYIIIFSLFGVFFDIITPLPFKILIDNVLEKNPLTPHSFEFFLLGDIDFLSLGFIVVFLYTASNVLAILLNYFAQILIRTVSKDVIIRFSNNTFATIERMRHAVYRKKDIGDYIYRLSYDVSAISEIFESGILPMITNSIFIVITTVILFLISPSFALLSFLLVPSMALLLYVFSKRLGVAWKKSEYSNSLLFSFIEEILGQLKNVQAYNLEEHMLTTFQKKETRSLRYEFNAYSIQFLLNLFIGILIALGYAGIITYGISLVHAGLVTAGTLVIFLFYLDNLTNPCIAFMGAYTSMKEHLVKIQRISELLEQPVLDEKTTIKDTSHPLSTSPSIYFKNVSFFGTNDAKILQNATFTIPKEKITVIVGANGSGKTTIISLLMGFLSPSRGSILFNNNSISNFTPEELHSMSAYVPQEIELFKGTIRENILFGDTHASPQAIKKAASMANASHFIERMPQKYSFQVGERGSKLSGGQRQRILIARAFLKSSAKIIIMDEPLSAQDITSHKILIKNIKKFTDKKTVIIVSNILDIIKIADHVIIVNKGKIIAQGKNTSILKQKHLTELLISLT